MLQLQEYNSFGELTTILLILQLLLHYLYLEQQVHLPTYFNITHSILAFNSLPLLQLLDFTQCR